MVSSHGYRLVLMFCFGFMSVPGAAAEASAASSAAVPGSAISSAADTPPRQELGEVVVRGTRLWQMRAAILEAEQRFYARYNELNTRDEFDVHCASEAPLGTRLKQRVCRVAFIRDAQADYAQALFTGGVAQDSQLVELERRDEYHAHALAVINGDRRLRALARERERLQQRYEEERRKRFKDRWIIFE